MNYLNDGHSNFALVPQAYFRELLLAAGSGTIPVYFFSNDKMSLVAKKRKRNKLSWTGESENTRSICGAAVADPGFSRRGGGANLQGVGAPTYYWSNFPQNYMKT